MNSELYNMTWNYCTIVDNTANKVLRKRQFGINIIFIFMTKALDVSKEIKNLMYFLSDFIWNPQNYKINV